MEIIDDIPFALESSNKKLSIRSNQITFSEKEIQLRRNKFIYKRISYQKIEKFDVSVGPIIKNGVLIFIGSLLLMFLAFFFLSSSYISYKQSGSLSPAMFFK